MAKKKALIGAYGLFWQIDEVNWFPGHRRPWQMLGKVGKYAGRLRVCDFRTARGFYLLFDDYRASYIGLARGKQGLGQRLRSHAADETKEWSRFCWFAFDEVDDDESEGWSTVKQRDAVAEVTADIVVRELEALLIKVLGSRYQNQMRFIAGAEWEQVTMLDCQRGAALTKVDPSRLTDWRFRSALEELA